MKIDYEKDPTRGPGHGKLCCTGEKFPEGEYELVLQENSNKRYLSKNGWGDTESRLKVTRERNAEGELVILLGPDIIDELDVQEKYKVALIHLDATGGKRFQGRLTDFSVVPSQAGQAGNMEVYKDKPKAAVAPPPPPELEPVPEPIVPEPAPAPAMLDGSDTDTEAPVEREQEAPPDPTARASVADARPKKKGATVLLLVGLLLLLLSGVGGALWYFLLGPGKNAPSEPPAMEQPAQPEPPPVAQAEPEAETPAPEPAAQPEPPPAAQAEPKAETPAPAPAPAAQSTRERVNAFFASTDRSPAAAAQLSRELSKDTSEDQDAAYRLMYFAGEQGDTSALMDYAACLDPAKPQWGTIEKDAPAAWDIYEKAKASQPEAAQAQEALRTWVEEQAAAGNAQAAQWLRLLPPK